MVGYLIENFISVVCFANTRQSSTLTPGISSVFGQSRGKQLSSVLHYRSFWSALCTSCLQEALQTYRQTYSSLQCQPGERTEDQPHHGGIPSESGSGSASPVGPIWAWILAGIFLQQQRDQEATALPFHSRTYHILPGRLPAV